MTERADMTVQIVDHADTKVQIVGDKVVDLSGASPGDVLVVQPDGSLAPAAPAAGVTDHGALTGLADDDHPQYTTTAEATTIADTEAAAAVATHAAAADPHTGYLKEADYDANTILKADSDNTPTALTVAASTVVGRKASGSIVAMTMAELKSLLALAQSDVSGLVADLATKVNGDMPTGAVAENMPRRQGGTHLDNSLTSWASGTLFLSAIPLVAGITVTSISMLSGATGAAGATHCWFSLWSPSRGKLGVTNDDTAASPWALATVKTMSLVAPYVVPTTGLYYVGAVVVATTMPTLRGAAPNATLAALAPILGGTSDASLTDPASAPTTAAAITAKTAQAYAYAL